MQESKEWTEIRSVISRPQHLRRLVPVNCQYLSIITDSFFSGEKARILSEFHSIRELRLGCDVGRKALKHLLKLPALEKLDIFCIRSPGRKIGGFDSARCLTDFRSTLCLSENDLNAIALSKSIVNLDVLGANVSLEVVKSLVKMPNLRSLNLEATNLDDDMAMVLATSSNIASLDIGATNITDKGFKAICNMKQLKSLDAWAVKITETDLVALSGLPNLEYLSVGSGLYTESMSAKDIIPHLENVPSLRQLWLDGVIYTQAEEDYLRNKYDTINIREPDV